MKLFKVGDKVRHEKFPGIIYEVKLEFLDGSYRIEPLNADMGKAITYATEDCMSLIKEAEGEWDITQAKDGDIVADTDLEYPFVGIFHNLNDDGTFNVYCYMERGKNPEFDPSYYLPLRGTYSTDNKTAKGIGPATEEQKKMFFDLMKKWGYKWDTEKKELKYTEEKKRWVHKHAVFTNWPDDLPCTYCSAGWAMPWTWAKEGKKSTHQFMCRCLPDLFHDSIPSYNRDCKEAQEWFNQNREKYELRDNEDWYVEPAFYFACHKYIKKKD